MTLLYIRVQDAQFSSRDDGADYDRPEAALAAGVRGAVGIVSEEIGRGERNAAVKISVEREDGTEIFRSVLAMSVSPLLVSPRPPVLRTIAGEKP